MSDAPIKLVTPPTMAEEIREGIRKLLADVSKDAEAGTFAGLFVLVVHSDGTWSREWSGTEDMSAMIGRLEISKQEWIAEYSKKYGS